MGARRAVQDGIDTARPGPSRDQPVMASQSAPLPAASHAGRTANPARKPESEVLRQTRAPQKSHKSAFHIETKHPLNRPTQVMQAAGRVTADRRPGAGPGLL